MIVALAGIANATKSAVRNAVFVTAEPLVEIPEGKDVAHNLKFAFFRPLRKAAREPGPSPGATE